MAPFAPPGRARGPPSEGASEHRQFSSAREFSNAKRRDGVTPTRDFYLAAAAISRFMWAASLVVVPWARGPAFVYLYFSEGFNGRDKGPPTRWRANDNSCMAPL
jgi:hypothetical protein